eukprot:365587-Chlamydomonas_euryale.AAC.1
MRELMVKVYFGVQPKDVGGPEVVPGLTYEQRRVDFTTMNAEQVCKEGERGGGAQGCVACLLHGSLVGWLAGWLVAWLSGWKAGWLDEEMGERGNGWLAGWADAQPPCHSACQQAHLPSLLPEQRAHQLLMPPRPSPLPVAAKSIAAKCIQVSDSRPGAPGVLHNVDAEFRFFNARVESGGAAAEKAAAAAPGEVLGHRDGAILVSPAPSHPGEPRTQPSW